MKAKLLLILFGISTAFAAGTAAFREGRFRDAVREFTAAEAESAGDPSPALERNLAIAASFAGDWAKAKIAAEKVAVFEGESGEIFRDRIFAMAEYRRADFLEAVADMPGASAEAYDDAIRAVDAALDLWRRSIIADPSSEASKRNVERALLRIEDLGAKKTLAEKRDDRKKREKKPNPRRDPNARPDEAKEEKRSPRTEKPFVIRSTDLSDDAVKRLMDRLDQKNEEKAALRRARLLESGVATEKDW